MVNRTPLRYPGGKSMMTPLFIDILNVNKLHDVTYAEPYAGGAGAAINLLLGNYVSRILINDASPAIYSFWKYVKEDNQRFVDAILNCDVDLTNWKRMHDILKSGDKPSFDLGFATFFLSRTNRSGILNAGPIGGATEESQYKAHYKINCRFNKSELAKRVEAIGKHSKQIVVTNKDAIKFLKDLKGKNMFVYLDPPYYKKGQSLYLDYYKADDHKILGEYLLNTNKFKWVLSYDNVKEIREIYKSLDLYFFYINYTAQNLKVGNELLTHSRNIRMPETPIIKMKEKNIPLIKIDSL
jgi:DNA adenine methylase